MRALLAGWLLLLLVLASPSQAASWRSRVVVPGPDVVVHAVDVGPGASVATVVERRNGAGGTLELREPTGVRTLAESPLGFSNVLIDSDDRGRRTVVWGAPSSGDRARTQLFVDENGTTRRLTRNETLLEDEQAYSLDVAPGGQAVLTYFSEAMYAAYRSAGDGTLAPGPQVEPGTIGALAGDGTATLVAQDFEETEFGNLQRYVMRRIAPDGTVSRPVLVNGGGRRYTGSAPELVVTPGGRAVVVWRRDRTVDLSEEDFGDERTVESRVQAATWKPGTSRPGRPRLLSPPRRFAEEPRAVPGDGFATVAWVQRVGKGSRERATVFSRSLDAGGAPSEHRLRRTTGFLKYSRAPLLIPSSRSRGLLLYPVRGVWYSLELDRPGRPRREQRVTPVGDDVRELHADVAAAGPVAAWRTNAGARVGRPR